MGKEEASVEELVGMIERGELRLPELQRRYVWRSTRVRDLLDSLIVAILRGLFCYGRPKWRYQRRKARSKRLNEFLVTAHS